MELKYATLVGMTSSLDGKHYIDFGVSGKLVRLNVSDDARTLIFNMLETLQNHSFHKHESFLLKVAMAGDYEIVTITDTSESVWVAMDSKYLCYTDNYVDVSSFVEKVIELKESQDKIIELEDKLSRVLDFATNSKMSKTNYTINEMIGAISDTLEEEYDKGYGDSQSSMPQND